MCACLQVPPIDSKFDDECSPDLLAKEQARLSAELADAKKKFMAVAKRKQQEYTKKVNDSPISTADNSPGWLSWALSAIVEHVLTKALEIASGICLANGVTMAFDTLMRQAGCIILPRNRCKWGTSYSQYASLSPCQRQEKHRYMCVVYMHVCVTLTTYMFLFSCLYVYVYM